MRTLWLIALTTSLGLLSLLASCACNPSAGACNYEGQGYAVGERFPSGDDCNDCTCLSNGTVSCTEKSCDGGEGEGEGEGEDAGPIAQYDAGPIQPPTDCVDNDGDGFYTCLDDNYPEWPQVVDCDDARWYVQPGGYEFPDNDVDDNCDDVIDEAPDCECRVTGELAADDVMAAMDFCDYTLLNVNKTGDPEQFGVFTDYFTDVEPTRGECLAVMSTGGASADSVSSGTKFCSSGTGCGSFSSNPCGVDPDPQGEGEAVCDLATLSMELAPPPNAKGFEFKFMFMSAEWPEFLCKSYNDTFYTIVETGGVAGGEPTNVSFDPQERDITVNVGFFELPRNWTVDLSSTPFGQSQNSSCSSSSVPGCQLPEYCSEEGANTAYVGSGSGWLTTRAPFEPGEESITVTFTIHDEGDGIYDSLVVLDDFRWVPYKPEAGTSK